MLHFNQAKIKKAFTSNRCWIYLVESHTSCKRL